MEALLAGMRGFFSQLNLHDYCFRNNNEEWESLEASLHKKAKPKTLYDARP